MRWLMMMARMLAVLAAVAATAHSTERLARSPDAGALGGRLYKGAPFTYRAIPLSSPWFSSAEQYDRAALAANFGLFALISLMSAIGWSRAMRPRDPSQPIRLPLGAEPLPPDATVRNNPRLRRMAIGSGACLAALVAGAFTGVGLALGLAGWWYGSHLCGRYEMLGRRPHWMAVAARTIALAMVVTSVLVAMGVLFHWGIR